LLDVLRRCLEADSLADVQAIIRVALQDYQGAFGSFGFRAFDS
jgi:hypothetical protein